MIIDMVGFIVVVVILLTLAAGVAVMLYMIWSGIFAIVKDHLE